MDNTVPCTPENVQRACSTDVADGGDDGTDDDDLRRTINKLVQENQTLQGKLRGYQTLTNLFQESKCELHKLQEEKRLLQSQMDMCFSEGNKCTSPMESELHVSTESGAQIYTSAVSHSGQLTRNTDHVHESGDIINTQLSQVEQQGPSVGSDVFSHESPTESLLPNQTMPTDVHAVSVNVTMHDDMNPQPRQTSLADQRLPQSREKELQHPIDTTLLQHKLFDNLRESTLSKQGSQLIMPSVDDEQREVGGINGVTPPNDMAQTLLLPSGHQLSSPETLTDTNLTREKQNTMTGHENRTDKTVTHGLENFIETNIYRNVSRKGIPIGETYRQCSEPSYLLNNTPTSIEQNKWIKSSSESQINKVTQQQTENVIPQILTEGTVVTLGMSTSLSPFPDLTHNANLNKGPGVVKQPSEYHGIVNMEASSGIGSPHVVEGDASVHQSTVDPVLFSRETSFRGMPGHPIAESMLPLEQEVMFKNLIPSEWIENGHRERLVSGLSEMRSEDDNNFMSRVLVVTSELEKMARSEQMRKTLVETLRTENRQLRAKLMTVSNEKESNAMQNRQEVGMLLGKIKRVEHERDQILFRSASPECDPNSWVKVDLETQMENGGSDIVGQENYSQLIAEVKRLQEENHQLMQAIKTSASSINLRGHLEQLQKRLDIKDRQMEENKANEEARMKDVDSMLMNRKSEYYKLENEYEQCSSRLDEANTRIMSLESVVQELREQNRQLRQSKELRMDRQKQQTKQSDVAPVRDQAQIMIEELTNDKEALKQQLLLFQEDYQRERRDHTRAHSMKEEMKKKIEFLKERLKAVEEQKQHSDRNRQTAEIQTTRLEQQLHGAEDTVQKTLDENEKLHRQVTDLQKMVAGQSRKAGSKQATAAPLVFPQVRKWNVTTAPPAQRRPAAPELLPGAWKCYQCSFINYPGRNVCEMCGFITINRDVPDQSSPLQPAEAPQQNLVARSDYLMNNGFNTSSWSDITTDSASIQSPDEAKPS